MSSLGDQFISWFSFGSKIAIGLVVAAAGLLYVHQEKLLYMPYPPNFPRTPKENPPGYISPTDYTIDGLLRGHSSATPIPYAEHFVTTKDGAKIHTWLLLRSNSNTVPTLIYFHGNAGNMGFRLKNAAEMYSLANMNILMVDYRGYGKIQGSPKTQPLV
jgi:dipeptidyl aminopeptidase/acylaminoacyl peptidase